MTINDRNKLLTKNAVLWLVASLIPAGCSIAFENTRFFWPMLLP